MKTTTLLGLLACLWATAQAAGADLTGAIPFQTERGARVAFTVFVSKHIPSIHNYEPIHAKR